jgi:hypothetical protein
MMFFGDTEAALNRIAYDDPSWSWVTALAAAEHGVDYRITDIVFSMVRDRCRDLSLAEGEEIRCVDNQPSFLCLERSDGCRVSLERHYAWFVQVEPIDGRARVRGH